ncbi:MAG: SDR family NAD(P)-dependent oxidoreductase [Cyclobacteriaceae bacterium]|nr:SDR family NAD(P)-dependent oxidoreductase [Cyclobacteriaceae bacterium]
MIAVTGATGLLGNAIIQQLMNDGYQVVAITRKIKPENPTNEKLVWREADVTDPVSLHEAFTGVDGVIHAAALVSFNPRQRKELFQINVTGTRNVVNACINLGIKRLVYISSVAALGRKKNQTVIDEDNPWTDSALNTWYAESKYRGELEVFRAQEEGLSTAILNPSVILTRGNWNNSSARLFKYVWKEMPFYIEGSLNYVDGRDAATLAVKLYFSGFEGERFIANAGTVTFKNFFDAVAKRFQRRPPSIKVSGNFLKVLSSMEQLRARLGGDPLITRETAQLADTFFAYDNRKIKHRLGFSFQSFESTIDWCCSYYLDLLKIQNNR